MMDDELDFESIQRIFAKRDADKKEKEETQAKNMQSSMHKKTSSYTTIELRDEPKYNNMHAKNIKITPKGKKKAQNNQLKLAIGVALAITIGVIAYNNIQEAAKPVEDSSSAIVYFDEKYGQKEQESIDIANCDFSNLTIILRESTSNAGGVVTVANQELTEMGADARAISSTDDMIDIIAGIKAEDANREIIVINVDGVSNKGTDEAVIMTNYSNSAKSADALAMAIYNANEDIYGITSDIRCGKKDLTNGKRTETSVEVMLDEAGYNDVVCLTVAPNSAYLEGQTNVNNLATSIAEGVVRLATMKEEDRYADLIRRVQFGDTISQYAVDYNVSESYIKSMNKETLSYNNGILQYDSSIIVAEIPSVLTSKVTINNPFITTNPNDIKTSVSYYTVKANDTISEIAENLNISASDMVIPSGNPNLIQVGDKIGYETTTGPILVSKTTEKSK